MNYAGYFQDNDGNNYYPEARFKRSTYSNTLMKNGSLEFYKYGRIVYVYCTGDGINIPNSFNETVPYITGIDKQYLPINGFVAISSFNNTGYIFLEINSQGNAIIRNYTGQAITTPTNCGFIGCYMSAI